MMNEDPASGAASLNGRRVGEALAGFRSRLAPVSQVPLLEAALVLAHAAGMSKTWILAHPDAVLTLEQDTAAEELVVRRISGIPLPYLVGKWEFFGLEFLVNPGVLIPRPETELLVETALEWLRLHPRRRRLLDVACGSGCIGISLAVNSSRLSVTCGDISPLAARTAGMNARHHAVAPRVAVYLGDLARPLAARFDILCANLPYIPSARLADLEVARHEPGNALDGGPDGLDLVRQLLADVPRLVAPGGLALLEIDASQGHTCLDLARQAFPTASVQVLPDLAGLDRLLSIQLA